jgi:hypothetical protein
VGAAEVCKHGNQLRSRSGFLGTGYMQVIDAELWAIGLVLAVTMEKRAIMQEHGVKTVAVFCDVRAAIRRAAHLKPGPAQTLVRRITRSARNLIAHDNTPEIHWVLGHSGIPRYEEADRQVTLARDASGSSVMERPYTLVSIRPRRISKERSAAKARWESDRYTKHFSYRLKSKAWSKRLIPMTRVKSLAARFYRLKLGHAPTGVYLKRFGNRDDEKCWWCGGTLSQTLEHLFRRCSQWNHRQKELCKAVGKATGWKEGKCRHIQITELFSIGEFDQAVMDFLVATEVWNFPRRAK